MPHPLGYFTNGQPSEVKSVGPSGGYGVIGAGLLVFDLFYKSGGATTGKSILIQTAADQFFEIWRYSGDTFVPPITPSKIVDVAGTPVLATRQLLSGTGGFCDEAYWVIDSSVFSSGPHELDFSKVRDAIAKALPSKTYFRGDCEELNVEAQYIRAYVKEIDATCNACGVVGVVYAHFHLDGYLPVLTDVKYVPNQQ
jgi:hypothetical protein